MNSSLINLDCLRSIIDFLDVQDLISLGKTNKEWKLITADTIKWNRLFVSHCDINCFTFLKGKRRFKAYKITQMNWKRGLYHTTLTSNEQQATFTQMNQNWNVIASTTNLTIANKNKTRLRTSKELKNISQMALQDDLLAVGIDHKVHLYNLSNKTFKRNFNPKIIFNLNSSYASSFCFHKSLLAVGTNNSELSFFNLENLEQATQKHTDLEEVVTLCGGKDNRILFSGSKNGIIFRWDLNLQKFYHYHGANSSISCMKAIDDNIIVIGSLDNTLAIQDSRMNQIKSLYLRDHQGTAQCLNICYSLIISGSTDNSVRLWDMRNLNRCIKIATFKDRVTSLQSDNNKIVSGSNDGMVHVASLINAFNPFEIKPSKNHSVKELNLEYDKISVCFSNGLIEEHCFSSIT